MVELRGAAIVAEFEACVQAFRDIVAGNQETASLGPALDKELAKYRARGYLTLAFVGEYSAGKSTIVSALTGRGDIKISADIATDRVTEYEWKGIHLVDTPGLFTEHKDHDDKTYDAISRSDLLAFCLTHSLFDAITVENFKKLAFDMGYQHKMMLVINKMSAEANFSTSKLGIA